MVGVTARREGIDLEVLGRSNVLMISAVVASAWLTYLVVSLRDSGHTSWSGSRYASDSLHA
jgi:hypothetical protein